MSTRNWRGGVVGAGTWSDAELGAWATVGNARIVALCDRHPDRATAAARRFGIDMVFDDAEVMLDRAELDFVDICTRPESHAALVAAAAKRRLAVLCQKPFCTSLVEASQAVEQCRSAGVRLMINENFRWQAWYRKARELLDADALGMPFLASIHKRVRITLPRFNHPQIYLKTMPRLILYEAGVHYLDTFRYLFGEPSTVFARLHRISPDVLGEDAQVIVLGYPHLTGLIDNSWASVLVPGRDKPTLDGPAGHAPCFEIDGSRATLSLQSDGNLHLVSEQGCRNWEFPADTIAASHAAALRHFVDCFASGVAFETSGDDNLRTMSLLYACYESARQCRAIAVV